eukprot:g5673.t2
MTKRPFFGSNEFWSWFTRHSNTVTLSASSIYKAAKSGNVQRLQELLTISTEAPNRDALLNTEDSKGRTALTAAVLNGHLSCVELLLSFGADVNHMNWNQNGGTALHEAVSSWVPQNMIRLLLRYGATPFIENLSRNTAYDLASKRRDASLLRMFEKYGKFDQYLLIKSMSNSNGEVSWNRKWISVLPRYSCTRSFRDKEWIGDLLHIYEDASYEAPNCVVNVKDAFAAIEIDPGLNSEVAVLSTPSHSSTKTSVYILVENSRHKLTFNGLLKDLNKLARVVTGMKIQTSPDELVPDGWTEDDAALARRLQKEFDSENHSTSVQKSSLEMNGAGPSNIVGSSSSMMPENDTSSSLPTVRESTDDDITSKNGGDEGKCVVCLEAPKSAGFAHGTRLMPYK